MPLTPSATYNLPAYESGIQPTAFPIQYFFDEPFGHASEVSTTSHYADPVGHSASASATEWTPCQQAEKISNWVNTNPDAQSRAAIDQASPDIPAKPETVFPISYEQPLPQNQREAYYQYLADVLGPARGVQESVGSYKAFMTEQVQTYYERLLPRDLASAYPSMLSSINTPVAAAIPQVQQSTIISHVKPPFAEADYSKWLLYGGRSLASIAPSPAGTPASSQVDLNPPWLWAPQTDADSVESSLDISDILESPVLRSRLPTSIEATSVAPDMSVTTLNDLLRRAEQQASLASTPTASTTPA